jgi:hypothetical protein
MATQRLQTGDPWATAATTLGKAFTDDPNDLARAAYYGSASAKAQVDAQKIVDEQDSARRVRDMLARGETVTPQMMAEMYGAGERAQPWGQSMLAVRGNQPGATISSLGPSQIAAGAPVLSTTEGQANAEAAATARAAATNATTRYGYDLTYKSSQRGHDITEDQNIRGDATTRRQQDITQLTERERLAQASRLKDEEIINVIRADGSTGTATHAQVRDAPAGMFFPYRDAVEAAEIRARLTGAGGPKSAVAPHLSVSAMRDFSNMIQGAVNAHLGLPQDDSRIANNEIHGVDLPAIRRRAEELYQSGPLAQNVTASIDQAISETVGRGPDKTMMTPNWWRRNLPTILGGTVSEGVVKPGDTVPRLDTPGTVNGRVPLPGTGKGGTVGAGYAPGGAGQPGSESGTPTPGSPQAYAPGDPRVDPRDDSPHGRRWALGRNLEAVTGTPAWMTVGTRMMESGGRDTASSTVGSTGETAYGTMQIQQGALDDVNRALGTKYTPQDLERDATVSGRVGATYLRLMQNRYGDDRLAIAAYNWGLGKVDALRDANGGDAEKTLAALPGKVQNYVNAVMTYKPNTPGQPPNTTPYAPIPVNANPAPVATTGPIPPGPNPVPSLAPPGPIPAPSLGAIPPGPGAVSSVGPSGPMPVRPGPGAPGLPGSNLSTQDVNQGYMPGGFGAMGSPLLAMLAGAFGGPLGGAPGGVSTPQQQVAAPAVTTPQPAVAASTPSPRGAVNVGGKAVPIAQVLSDARSAIARGAPREAIIRKLKAMGIQPVGI